MFNKTFDLKSLLAFFFVLVLILEIGFISLFALLYTNLHHKYILEQFNHTLLDTSQVIDQGIREAKNNLLRLKDYVQLLEINNTESKDVLPYLTQMMASNLQFNPHQYNYYFALEPNLAQKYFRKDSYLLTVHKDYELINTDKYNDPRYSIAETWTDTEYQTNPQEVWYHIAKKSQQMEVNPIYFDSPDMKTWLYTLAIGLYDQDVFQGMVGIDILLDSWFESIAKNQIGQTEGVLLVDSNSGIVLNKVGETEGKIDYFQETKQRTQKDVWDNQNNKSLWQSIIKQESYGVLMPDLDEGKYLVSTMPLKQLPLTVVIYAPQSKLQAIIYRNMAIVGGVSILVLATLLGLMIWLHKKVTFPLNQLIAMMESLTKQTFSPKSDLINQEIIKYQVPIIGIVETQKLGTIFNHMLEELQGAFSILASHYHELEKHVAQRTKELAIKNSELEETLSFLQTTQAQLIQAEKMSSLGQMVAGISHEVNNPISFIYGNISHATRYMQNLLGLVQLYQQQYPQATSVIQMEIETIDLNFIQEDLPNLLNSMAIGAKRIRGIVHSLRNFSRLDEAEFKPADINEGIESALMILHHRFNGKEGSPEIQVIRDCPNLPLVYCYAGQLNQVFLNLIANAIDALEERCSNQSNGLSQVFLPLIEIYTEAIGEDWVAIHIVDNGGGIEEEIRSKIFDPFFSTKPVGKGTGLGLSICYQIIVDKHGGKIECHSTPGEGTEFLIKIPVKCLLREKNIYISENYNCTSKNVN